MTMTTSMTVDELKTRFDDEGYVILRDVIEPHILQQARLDLN